MTGKRMDGIETRQKLLAAATTVFAKKGYHDARVMDICKMAEANVASDKSIAAYPPDGGMCFMSSLMS